MIAFHDLNQCWRKSSVIGAVTIGHHVNVGLNISKDATNDMALALTHFGTDNCSCFPRNRSGVIT